MGSPVLDACMVACGSVDGFYIHGIQSWDVAAVAIIVREAGGVVMLPTGEHRQFGTLRGWCYCMLLVQSGPLLLPNLHPQELAESVVKCNCRVQTTHSTCMLQLLSCVWFVNSLTHSTQVNHWT